MNSKAILGVAVIFVAVIAGIAVVSFGDSNDSGNDSGNDTPTTADYVIDAKGREVSIPSNLDKGIVTIGTSGPLRFVTLFDVFDKIIEVDVADTTTNINGRGFSYAYPYYQLDPEKNTHPRDKLDTATAEKIGKKGPSLIVTNESIWNNNSENFESLASVCSIIVLKDQQMKYMTNSDGTLADYLQFNINILGKVLKKEDRAKEVVDGINEILDDIRKLSGTSDKKVYVAGMTISGSNTLNTTFPTYIPFTINNIKNAYNGGSIENKVVMNIESFTKMDMDMIVVDPSSSDKIKGNQDSQLVLKYLYTINNDADPNNDIPIYVTMPIVWCHINFDGALASAYYTAHLVYGTLTLDQVKEKINNVYTTFYGEHGKNIFDDMSKFFDGKSSANGQQMPLLGEVVVKKNGDEYCLVAA